MSFVPHIDSQLAKAQRYTENLRRLLPRYGGPSEHKRRLYKSVNESIMLYASSRRMGIGICRAFRTVSTDAIMVLSRTIPADLLVREAVRKRREGTRKKDARMKTLAEWEERWREGKNTAARTRRLIPNLTEWYGRKHGGVDYGVTQFLTGHGCFGTYFVRIRKREESRCPRCPGKEDSPEHVWDECPLGRGEGNLATEARKKGSLLEFGGGDVKKRQPVGNYSGDDE
ncbi:UNVERIFIED_CONTAM: hypothetical protein PYX00_008820 [Menopon gallinae]|uniref:Reverse transcriptase n=1 Tax=Menopon gallinae TaxID=328185 RepID=A0AAW2HQD3_9NEOP